MVDGRDVRLLGRALNDVVLDGASEPCVEARLGLWPGMEWRLAQVVIAGCQAYAQRVPRGRLCVADGQLREFDSGLLHFVERVSGLQRKGAHQGLVGSVSYTHLTLPTSDLV